MPQPVLTKAGCNMGACHGSLQGRGGLMLSLLGYDAAKDYDALFKNSRVAGDFRPRPRSKA